MGPQMSDSSSGGGSGCATVIVTWTAIVAFVLYFGYGYAAEDAIWTGASWVVGVLCGLPLLILALLALGLLAVKTFSAWDAFWDTRARRRWDDDID